MVDQNILQDHAFLGKTAFECRGKTTLISKDEDDIATPCLRFGQDRLLSTADGHQLAHRFATTGLPDSDSPLLAEPGRSGQNSKLLGTQPIGVLLDNSVHCPSPTLKQTAQIRVALLANAEQALLTSPSCLFGREPKRKSYLSAAGNLARASCQQRLRGNRADAAHGFNRTATGS